MSEELKKRLLVHFILNNALYLKEWVYFVPRVGDEIRIKENEFYTVKRIVWVYDESENFCSRANVEIEAIKDLG